MIAKSFIYHIVCFPICFFLTFSFVLTSDNLYEYRDHFGYGVPALCVLFSLVSLFTKRKEGQVVGKFAFWLLSAFCCLALTFFLTPFVLHNYPGWCPEILKEYLEGIKSAVWFGVPANIFLINGSLVILGIFTTGIIMVLKYCIIISIVATILLYIKAAGWI